MPKTLSQLIGLATTLLLMAAVWWLLAPQRMGGATSMIIIHGSSMEPLYHTGDLVIGRAADHYEIGEIVIYNHPDIGPVIHRIIGRNGSRWVFQGDHNNFIDPYQPTDSELLGRAVLHLPHVGQILVGFRNPPITALSVLAIGLPFMLRIAQPQQRTARRKTIRLPESPGAAGAVAVLAVLAFALGGWAWLQPAQREIVQDIPYQHSGSFHYQAAAPAGIYDTNAATTGQPIFWQLSHQLDIDFTYQFEADQASSIETQAELGAVLRSTDGWSRTFALAAPVHTTGNSVSLHGQIDLDQLHQRISELESSTGMPRREYILAIQPRIQVQGQVAGQRLNETFAPSLNMRSNEFQLMLIQESERDVLAPVQGSSVAHPTSVQATLAPFLPLPVAPTRTAAPLAGLLLLAAAAVLAGPKLRQLPRLDQAAQIRLRYSHLLIELGGWQDSFTKPERAVSDPAALARLAERHATFILHEAQAGRHRYSVLTSEAAYTYTCGGSVAPALPEPAVIIEYAAGDWQPRFLSELQARALPSEASRAAGVAVVTAYREREHNQQFALAWDAARSTSNTREPRP